MNNRILVIGANGMLGGSVFRYLTRNPKFQVLGTVRSPVAKDALMRQGFDNIVSNLDVVDLSGVASVIREFEPDYVLNCVGVIKQLDQAKSPIALVRLNSLFPHQLAQECEQAGAKLIHFSTDCVFSGKVGGYHESDVPDAADLYGRSKLLGEIAYGPNLTLRTSIIGHELSSAHSLVDWFLSQSGQVNGYRRAVFSGLPTVCVAEFLEKYVFGTRLRGLLHLASSPIDKYSLLSLINDAYSLEKDIVPFDEFEIDRSLSSTSLTAATDFKCPAWPELIKKMREEYLAYFV